MNVKKVIEKIGVWQLAADNLKPALPIDDEVFESWVNKMESFMKDFPLLQLLSNDALKVGLVLSFLFNIHSHLSIFYCHPGKPNNILL